MSEHTIQKLERGIRRFWFVVHNCVAHPLLVTDKEWAVTFHDWTAEKMEQ